MSNPSVKNPDAPAKKGGFFTGIMAGLAGGTLIAAGVALYISHLSSPLMPRATPSQPMPVENHTGNTDAAKRGFLSPTPVTSNASDAAAANTAATSTDKDHNIETASAPQAAPSTNMQGVSTSDTLSVPVSHTPAPATSSLPSTLGDELHPVSVRYFIQTGAFALSSEAENQRANLALLGVDSTVMPSDSNGKPPYYRVRVGPFSSVDEVRNMVKTLKDNNISAQVLRETTTSRSSLIPHG